MSFLLVSSTLFAICSAIYITPYYGGFFDDRRSDYSGHGNKYIGYGSVRHGHDDGYDASNYGKAFGEDGYYGREYAADGHYNYANGGADSYDGSHHDLGARNAQDSEDMKKYSYFASGSGPEGSYTKGYYGSEGYEHADSKSKHAADANGSGYKKDFSFNENDHADAHSVYDKAANGHSGFERSHDDSHHGFNKDRFEKGGHTDGWFNGDHVSGRSIHKPSY